MPISSDNKLVKILALLFSSGILLCLIFFPLNSHAAFTKQINYQGKLTNASGVAVSDATRSIVFSLYTAASGGTAIWTETDSVATTNGLFSVMLGAVSSLDNVNFNQPLYLGINVAGDGEMTPRKILGSVPSAFDSLRLDGNASSTNIDISNYLVVSGTSTLATTTMAFGSWVGDGATKINFSNLSFGAAGSVPMISFSSPTFNPGSPALTYGAMGDGLVIYENSGSMNPEFRLLDKNFHSAAIQFSTSTNTMHFTDASNYYIDFRSNNDAGLKIGNDTNYFTISNRPITIQTMSGPLTTEITSIRPNTLSNNANYWETQGGFIISEASSTSLLGYNGDPILQFGNYDLSSGMMMTFATTTKELRFSGYGGFATTSFYSDLTVTNGGNNNLKISNKTFGPFQFETMQFYSSSLAQSMGAIEGHLVMFDSLDANGGGNDNPSIMFASRPFDREANITFATTSNQLEFRDATHYYFRDGSVGINTETPDGVSKFLVTGGTKLAGNATTTGYLTIGTAPTGAGFAAGDLNLQNSLVVGNGITLGGVFRNTWPTGSGSASVGFWATSSTNALIGYPDLDGEYAIVVGAEATTSPNTKFEVNGNSKLGGTLTVTGLSTLANASATVFSVSGNSYLSTTQVDGNLNVTAGNYYKYNGVNLASASTTLYNYYFGGAQDTDLVLPADGELSSPASNGGLNLGMGPLALYSNTPGTTGGGNIAIGLASLLSNTSGIFNTGLGVLSLGSNQAGSYNVAVGDGSLRYNLSNTNTAMGHNALAYNTLGSSNVAIGVAAGGAHPYEWPYDDTESTIDDYMTFVGAWSSRDGTKVASTTSLNRGVAIGYNAKVGGSNMMALGGLDSDSVNVGIATSTPAFALVVGSGHTAEGLKSVQVPYGSLCVDNDGYCTPSGTAGNITARSYTTGGADLAENYTSSLPLETGDIVSPLGGDQITKATTDQLPLGIVSTQPGITMGNPNDSTLTHQYPIALSGRVPVKVNLEGGPIKVGDPITLSSVSGVGTKATSSTETIGIALESFNSSTQGQILVFVKLGYAHLDSQISNGQITAGNLWTQDETTGHIKALASLDLNNLDLLNVRTITSASGKWSIDEEGNIVTQSIRANKLCLGETCVDEAQLKILLQNAQLLPSTPINLPIEPTTSSTPPVASSSEPTPLVIGSTPPAEEPAPPATEPAPPVEETAPITE